MQFNTQLCSRSDYLLVGGHFVHMYMYMTDVYICYKLILTPMPTYMSVMIMRSYTHQNHVAPYCTHVVWASWFMYSQYS